MELVLVILFIALVAVGDTIIVSIATVNVCADALPPINNAHTANSKVNPFFILTLFFLLQFKQNSPYSQIKGHLPGFLRRF
jgi:hypothetical protein